MSLDKLQIKYNEVIIKDRVNIRKLFASICRMSHRRRRHRRLDAAYIQGDVFQMLHCCTALRATYCYGVRIAVALLLSKKNLKNCNTKFELPCII